MSLISRIYRTDTPTTPEQMFELARTIWHRNKPGDPVVIWPDLMGNDFDKQAVLNAAAKQYGHRAQRKDKR